MCVVENPQNQCIMLIFLYSLIGLLSSHVVFGGGLYSKIRNGHHVTKIRIDKKPQDPFYLDLHMTRYVGACVPINEPYNPTVPWIRNFDLILTSCGVDWKGSWTTSGNVCSFVYDVNDTMKTPHASEIVHLHPDPRFHKHFMANFLPVYEKRYQETKEHIILHTGGADNSVGESHALVYLNSPAIKRWVVEQNKLPVVRNHPEVIQLPIGPCPREAHQTRGETLRRIINQTYQYLTSSFHQEASEYSTEAIASLSPHKVKFQDRKNRVLFCFHHENGTTGVGNRFEVYETAKKHCTVCDFCDDSNGALPHDALWTAYTQYKFVFSPRGIGFDCGRTIEIMLLGAIPIIDYWEGAIGYQDGGLDSVIVRNISEVNEENLKHWLEKYTKSVPLYRLSRVYLEKRAFDD